jgi:hypothetical protein
MTINKKNYVLGSWDSYTEYEEPETRIISVNTNPLQVLRIDVDLKREFTAKELNGTFNLIETVLSWYGFELQGYKTGGNGFHVLIQLPYETYLPMGCLFTYMIRETLRAIFTDKTLLTIDRANTDNQILRLFGTQHPTKNDLACLIDFKNRQLFDYPEQLAAFDTKLRCSGINKEEYKHLVNPAYEILTIFINEKNSTLTGKKKLSQYSHLPPELCKQIIEKNPDVELFNRHLQSMEELQPTVSIIKEELEAPVLVSEAQESPIVEPVKETLEEDFTDLDALIKKGFTPGNSHSRLGILVNAYYTKYGDAGYDLLCHYIYTVPEANETSFADRLRSLDGYWNNRRRIKPKKAEKIERPKRKITISRKGSDLRKEIFETLNLKIQPRQLKTLIRITDAILSEMIKEDNFTNYTLNYKRLAEALGLTDKVVSRSIAYILSKDSLSENIVFVKNQDYYIRTRNIDPNPSLIKNDNIYLVKKYR